MVDQPQLFVVQIRRQGSRIDVEARERELASASPMVDLRLDARSPHEVGLVGRPRAIFGHRDVIVRATNLVLSAVAAGNRVNTTNEARRMRMPYHCGKFSSHLI